MTSEQGTKYRVAQLARVDGSNLGRNIGVTDLESLVTHHPVSNRNARFEAGQWLDVEELDSRSYALVSGEVEEVRDTRVDKRLASGEQSLLVKDFLLEHPRSAHPRIVDVPAPAAGRVGRVSEASGLVQVDDNDGRVIYRVRHLGPIAVKEGDEVAYGQSLGVQNLIGVGGRNPRRHVHIEFDMQRLEEFDGYVRDLVDGRLAVEAEHREGVLPRAPSARSAIHVGGSGARVVDVQRAVSIESRMDAAGLASFHSFDGMYRNDLQPTVLKFQERHGLPQNGDIDWPTWRRALDVINGVPPVPPPVIDGMSPPPYLAPFDRMHDRIRQELETLEGRTSALTPENRDAVAHALVAAAVEQRMEGFDHLVVGEDRRATGQGVNLFLVRGRLDDPAQVRAWADVSNAGPAVDNAARARNGIERLVAERTQRQDPPQQPMPSPSIPMG